MRFVHLSNARLFSENKPNKFDIDFAAEHLEAFKKVVALCRETVVDALFLTGNIFASDPTGEQVAELDRMLSEAKDTRVFLLTGTEDETAEDSALATHTWTSNVQVFIGDCIQRVYVQKFGFEVTGIGYSQKTWSQADLQKISRGKKGKYQFLLLPSVEGKGTADEIRALNLPFDYVGIGGEEVVSGEMGARIYAPGDFLPQGFSRRIEHGFYLGEIAEGKEKQATIQFLSTDCREFIPLQLRLDETSTIEKVAGDVKRVIEKYGEKNLYHISLTGEGRPEFYFEKKALYELGRIVEVKDAESRTDALNKLMNAHGDDAIGRFLAEMRTDESSPARRKALDYGMDALLSAQKEAATC